MPRAPPLAHLSDGHHLLHVEATPLEILAVESNVGAIDHDIVRAVAVMPVMQVGQGQLRSGKRKATSRMERGWNVQLCNHKNN